MNYTVINKDGIGLYESDVLSDAVAYVNDHQSGDENDTDYAYAVIDRSQESSTRNIVLQLNTTDDADILAELDSVPNIQTYIKELIRANV